MTIVLDFQIMVMVFVDTTVGPCGPSPAEAYENELEVNSFERSVSVSPHHKIYYVWDHVCIAFHMEPGWVLHVDQDRLFKRVNVCEMCNPYLLRAPDTNLSLHDAESKLADLKAGVWS